MLGMLVGKYHMDPSAATRCSPNAFFVIATDDILSARSIAKEVKRQKRLADDPKADEKDLLYAFAKKHGA